MLEEPYSMGPRVVRGHATSLDMKCVWRMQHARASYETVDHVPLADLEAGLDEILASPSDVGTVALIARRPAVDVRETLTQVTLSKVDGLVGDRWRLGGSRDAASGPPDRGRQITMMNARVVALLAGTRDRWALAGDQLYVDLDLSVGNLPAGTRLAVGTAVIEVSGLPHRGCKKFGARFGLDTLRFVNSPQGYALNLRGVNTTVIEDGVVNVGDVIKKIS